MRKGGLIFLGVLGILTLLVMWLFSDRIIERNLEKIGDRIVGARVDFVKVHFSPFNTELSWKHLEVTNPDNTFQNIFETGKCSFKLRLSTLLKKKLIVDDFYISGLQFNTPRKSNGSLKSVKRGKKRTKNRSKKESKIKTGIEKTIKEEKKKIPLFNPKKYLLSLNFTGLVENFKPDTPAKLKKLLKDYDTAFEKWNKSVVDYGDEVNLFLKETKTVVSNINLKTKDINELKDRLILVKKYLKKADELKKKGESLLNGLSKEYNRMRGDVDRVDNWVNEDYLRLKEKLKIPELSKRDVSLALFGRDILDKIDRMNRAVKKVRAILNKVRSVVPKKDIPKRRKGTDIEFIREKDLPNFWFKRLFIGGKTKRGIELRGSVLNLTSNQKITGIPTTIALSGNGRGGEKLLVSGKLNYTGDTPSENFDMNFSNMPVESYTLGEAGKFGLAFENGTVDISTSLDFSGNRVESGLDVEGHNLVVTPKASGLSEEMEDLINELFSNIDRLNLKASIVMDSSNVDIKVKSNIGNIIIRNLKRIYSERISRVDGEIRAFLKNKNEEYRQEYLKSIDGKYFEVKQKIDNYRELIYKQQKELLLQKKMLERSVRDLLKSQVEKQIDKKKKEAEKIIEKKKKGIEKQINSLF